MYAPARSQTSVRTQRRPRGRGRTLTDAGAYFVATDASPWFLRNQRREDHGLASVATKVVEGDAPRPENKRTDAGATRTCVRSRTTDLSAQTTYTRARLARRGGLIRAVGARAHAGAGRRLGHVVLHARRVLALHGQHQTMRGVAVRLVDVGRPLGLLLVQL